MKEIKSVDGVIYDREEAIEILNSELMAILESVEKYPDIIKGVIENNKKRKYFDHHHVDGLRCMIEAYYTECGDVDKVMEHLKWSFAMPVDKMYGV